MTQVEFYGAGFPYNPIQDLPGKLIVLEGTDGVAVLPRSSSFVDGSRQRVLLFQIQVCAVLR